MPTYIFDAEQGANTGSPTVSLQSGTPQWVRDVQLRTATETEYKGNIDYTQSFSVSLDESFVAGRYMVEIYRRFGNLAASWDGVFVQIKVNGRPKGGFYDIGFGVSDGSEAWVPLTNLDLNPSSGQAGGPRYLNVQPGDVVTFHYGSGAPMTPGRYMDVQKVRFTSIDTSAPRLPQWQQALGDVERWSFWSALSLNHIKAFGNKIYLFEDAAVEGVGGPLLGVFTYELNGYDITPLSGDTPLGGFTDLRTSLGTDIEVLAKDLSITDNGDVYAVWVEESGSFPSWLYRIVLKRWNGSSWSTISTDVTGTGGTTRFLPYVTMDTDGTSLYIAWSESRQLGGAGAVGFWWKATRYTPGGGFTALGGGNTAYPAADPTKTVDGGFDQHLRLKVSPAGVPWVVWPSYDPTTSPSDEYAHAWYWNGSSWQNSNLPAPSLVPPDNGPHHYRVADVSNPPGNYITFAVYGLYYVDITFCHHDGPSEYPAICFQYVYNSDEVSGQVIDHSGWAYFEYDGSNWNNELYVTEAVDIYADSPNQFRQAIDGDEGIAKAGGWTQGFSLDNDGKVPYLFSQKGYRISHVDRVYCARVKRDGSGFEEVGMGFPDLEAMPERDQAGWSDPTTNGGAIVNGTPVCYWRSSISWVSGCTLAAFIPITTIDLSKLRFRSHQRGDMNG